MNAMFGGRANVEPTCTVELGGIVACEKASNDGDEDPDPDYSFCVDGGDSDHEHDSDESRVASAAIVSERELGDANDLIDLNIDAIMRSLSPNLSIEQTDQTKRNGSHESESSSNDEPTNKNKGKSRKTTRTKGKKLMQQRKINRQEMQHVTESRFHMHSTMQAKRN